MQALNKDQQNRQLLRALFAFAIQHPCLSVICIDLSNQDVNFFRCMSSLRLEDRLSTLIDPLYAEVCGGVLLKTHGVIREFGFKVNAQCKSLRVLFQSMAIL